MRFILVNGRTPFGRFTCAKCGEAISNSYLREMTTHLYYCDQSCYSEHCVKAALTLKVAPVGLAPVRNKRSAEGDLTAST
ncbi:hypothetical protein [Bradyrhizobium erythrophlei]|jgi:hypothetical protein|uniref:Uncharacterized protein n=1 Tax=Bradyrhizobium erythrophlei TaxID=1437360 RepID=A0A1M7TE78_9BRAD|nr:hypothetical protein [Bradyrhizobium erythrophlei]SHN68958.1 hypothetical protein SAMN05444170_1468 [Bradyrhizobium erythrophlei]